MRHRLTTRIGTLAIFLTACCGYASGQECEPEWDTTVGNPGAGAGSLLVFDDGTGEMLYAGGGFEDVDGQPGTSHIARWDRDSNTWSGLDGGLIGGPRKMVSFDAGGGPELVVSGNFPGTVSGVPYTANIAKWNGSEWSALGTGIPGEFVFAMTTWDGFWTAGPGDEALYVGGRFPTAGGVTANGIAAWDGTQWHSMGDGITGWQPYVESMVAWDDGSGEKLYAAGRFDTMDGLNTPLIARWDGETWEQVGSGLINDMIYFGIESMAVHDDGSGPALYVGGYEFHAPGQPVGKVSKWDGQQWTTVGGLGDGVITDLCSFDDGNGPGLYRTGRSAPGWKYFARFVNDQWEIVGRGVWKDPFEPWPSTSSLCVWDDALYVGGFFNLVGDIYTSNGIAAWGCPASACPEDFNGNNVVDAADLAILLGSWGACEGCPADLNGDGDVGPFDLALLLGAWGPCP